MPSMTPEEILQIHKDYADQFASLAQSGLMGAFNALSASGIFDYTPSLVSITMPDFGNPKGVGTLPPLPDDPELPDLDDMENFVGIPNDNTGSAPPRDYPAAPTLQMPAKPPYMHNFTAVAPADPDDPTMPPQPSYIAMPALNLPYPTIDVPTAPILTMPIFDGQRPDALAIPEADAIVALYRTEMNDHRNIVATFAQGQADSLIAKYVPEFAALRARINQSIIDYTDPVAGGGVGIPQNIEGAIHARAGDRNNLEFQRALDTSADTLAKMGYTIPPGAMLDVLRQARTAMGDAMVKSSTDIATKNLELEQQNFQFMLKLGETLEEKLLDTVSSYLKLSLEMDQLAIAAAKEIVATYIAAYNLQVLVYRALWEGYRADADVFKTKIDALEATVRLYEAEIKAELAKTEVNNAHVNVLRAVADVNQSLAMAYKAAVDAAVATLEPARISTLIYESKARAYASEVAAYEARWRGYTAEVEGELGRVKAYEAQVNGYTAQVNGYRAKVEAYSAQVGAAAATNRAVADHNLSVVQTYKAQADAAIAIFNGRIAGYTAESEVILKEAQIEIEHWRTKANLIFQEYNVAVQQMFEYAREQMNLFRGQMEAAINAANGLAHASQVAGNLAGQAMGGLTSFAGILESKEG